MRSALLLALLLVASSTAAQVNNPWILQAGAVYHTTTGTIESMTMTVGDRPVLANGCMYAKLQPEFERGRAQMYGLTDDGTFLYIDLDNLTTAYHVDEEIQARPNGVAHPPLFVDMAVAGSAGILVDGRWYDDPYQGPGQHNYTASLIVTQEGFMEDGAPRLATDAANATLEPGDTEMHLRIRSPGEDEPTPYTVNIQRPAPTPTPVGISVNLETIISEPEHAERIPIPNLRYGGNGTVTLELNSQAPPGATSMQLRVRDPRGIVVGNATVDASLLEGGDATLTFPLDRFGHYWIETSGSLLLANYEVTFSQQALGPLDMRFAWEEVAYGLDAMDEFGDCALGIGQPNGEVEAAVVGRPQPPQMGLGLIVLGIVGGTAMVLTAVALIGNAVSTASHRSASKK